MKKLIKTIILIAFPIVCKCQGQIPRQTVAELNINDYICHIVDSVLETTIRTSVHYRYGHFPQFDWNGWHYTSVYSSSKYDTIVFTKISRVQLPK